MGQGRTGWEGLRRSGMGWDRVGRGWTELDGLGQDGTGCDEVGQGGTGLTGLDGMLNYIKYAIPPRHYSNKLQ